LSPNYFASEVCRKEWKAWIDQEIARHILTSGSAPIYIIEVPGLVSKPMLPEHEVARKVAELCGIRPPHDGFTLAVSPMVKEIRRRQLNAVQPFYHAGVLALKQADMRQVLHKLAQDLEERAQDVRRAQASENEVPAYNKKFLRSHDLTSKRVCFLPFTVLLNTKEGVSWSERLFSSCNAVFPGVAPCRCCNSKAKRPWRTTTTRCPTTSWNSTPSSRCCPRAKLLPWKET